MADPINATEILAAAHAQAIQDAAPTDESLNAGAFLPSEPIPDVLTNEVEADASTLREALSKLNEEPAPVLAQESNYNVLAYLRADLLTQKGMTQRIATEALQCIPTFGQGRPVNYYSRHPSQTGYKLALEEIEGAMAADVVADMEEQASRLHDVIEPEQFGKLTLDFKRRADQVSMQAAILKDFIRVATDNGFNWDDQTFQGCTVDPSQNVSVPQSLQLDKAQAYAFADMDNYYMAHFQMPTLLEQMTQYMLCWKGQFETQLSALKGNTSAKAEFPVAPKIVFRGGKTVTIDQAYDVFRDAYNEQRHEFDTRKTLTVVTAVGNAAEQSKGGDIIVRLTDYYTQASLTADTLKEVAAWVKDNGGDTVELQKLITAFVDVVNTMNRNVGEIHRWLVCASLATSYAGILTIKVTEVAWKSVHQCKDTLQMSEGDYTCLKTMVEDISAPQKTGVI